MTNSGMDQDKVGTITPEVKELIECSLMERAEAKTMETVAEMLKKKANDALIALMPAYNLKTYSLKGVGKITLKTSNGSSINRKKLTETLILYGVDPDDVTNTIKKSSTTWSKLTVEFKDKEDKCNN